MRRVAEKQTFPALFSVSALSSSPSLLHQLFLFFPLSIFRLFSFLFLFFFLSFYFLHLLYFLILLSSLISLAFSLCCVLFIRYFFFLPVYAHIYLSFSNSYLPLFSNHSLPLLLSFYPSINPLFTYLPPSSSETPSHSISNEKQNTFFSVKVKRKKKL